MTDYKVNRTNLVYQTPVNSFQDDVQQQTPVYEESSTSELEISEDLDFGTTPVNSFEDDVMEQTPISYDIGTLGDDPEEN